MKSLLRKAEYEALGKLHIDGRILDVGGSKKSGYHELIGGEHTFLVGNIDESYGIDVVFDAQKEWPVEAGSFDGVLFMNVLEHLYEHEAAVRGAARALKDRGIVAGVVPFMFNVHGSPNDYFRYTKAALERLFAGNGFVDIEVRELGSGAFSVIYHCLLGIMRQRWMARAVAPIFVGCDRLLARIKPGNLMSAAYYPLGYYFQAKKG